MEKNCSNTTNMTTSSILALEAQIPIVVYFTILDFFVIAGNIVLWMYIRKRRSESIIFIRMVIIGTVPAATVGKLYDPKIKKLKKQQIPLYFLFCIVSICIHDDYSWWLFMKSFLSLPKNNIK